MIKNAALFLVSNIYCVAVFWFFLKLSTAYRLIQSLGLRQNAPLLLSSIKEVFGTLSPGPHPLDWTVGIMGSALFVVFIKLRLKKSRLLRTKTEFGSARWGTAKDIEPFINQEFHKNIILTKSEFLSINTRPKNLEYARNLNCCVIGSSGSGKTRHWLIPNLLQAHSSYVVVDPKGEILRQTGAFFSRQGYRLKVYNSIDFGKSMHYNPLHYVKTEADIIKFVNALISNTTGDGKEGDEFWSKCEQLLYTALIGYIIYECPKEDQNLITLVDLLNLMEVRENNESFMNQVDCLFNNLIKRKPHCFSARQYMKYKLAAGKTAKSILISCGARLAPFDIDQLREVMSYDELELDKIGDRRTALFFAISDSDTTFNFIVALAFSQMFNVLCQHADQQANGRLKHHVRVLWDEAANTGQVPNLEKVVAIIRSREISVCLFLQAQAQLKTLYRDKCETIMGNMDSIIFLGGREHTAIKELSEALGKETVHYLEESQTKGQSPTKGLHTHKRGKELLSVDELTSLKGNKCILQLRGLRPFLSDKFDLKLHRNYRHLAEAGKHNTFDQKAIRRQGIALVPNETCSVYDVTSIT